MTPNSRCSSTSARSRPTTRTIALTIRERRAPQPLDEAQRRADAARYQEVTCRSALNRVKGMPFNWTLNPYRGCTHGCHYCFARRYQTQFELGPDDHFSSLIFVKVELRRRAAQELDQAVVDARAGRGRHRDRSLPADRRPLQADATIARSAARGAHADRLVTKGPMVVRDADVLAELGRSAGCTVYMSVPTVDEEAWRRSSPAPRIRCSGCARSDHCATPASTPAC